MTDKTVRHFGAVYTPQDYAEFLVSWAVRSHDQQVLDLGVGEGAFTFAVYNRLIELGARATDAQHQIFGTEIDPTAYDSFLLSAQRMNTRFPCLQQIDFFDADFPLVDAIVGNPPYIRRTYLRNAALIREKVTAKNRLIEDSIPKLTDMYVYFLLYALAFLRPEGRIGVITADSWLNVGYGRSLKAILLQHFEIECLISLDRRVFDDAQVRPVLLMATRKDIRDLNRSVHFVRVKNGLPIHDLRDSWNATVSLSPDIVHFETTSRKLKIDKPWGINLKAPGIQSELASIGLMSPMAGQAQTRIGLQTLAKEFFVLTPDQVSLAQIEREFLAPLAQSPRYFDSPAIENGDKPLFHLIYCDKTKDELRGTRLLEYILKGEAEEVSLRGKNVNVVGYHNKERIKSSGRVPWYNLKTQLDRRGNASILIPRLVYRKYTVVWNQAGYVPGELFIEFLPFMSPEIDLEVHLSVLASSVTEIMLRIHAQVYGGGTYNINPGQIKRVPILNAKLLTANQKEDLKHAYRHYLADQSHTRDRIDETVCRILGLDQRKQREIEVTLEDLRQIAVDSKKRSGDP